MADTKTAEEWKASAAALNAQIDKLQAEQDQVSDKISELTRQQIKLLGITRNAPAGSAERAAANQQYADVSRQIEQLKNQQSQLSQQINNLDAQVQAAERQSGVAETAPANTTKNTPPANPDPGPNTEPKPTEPAVPPAEPEPINTATEELTVPPGTDTEEEGGQAGLEEPEDIDESLGLPPGADPDEGPQTGLEEPPFISDELTVPPGTDTEEEGRQPGLSEPLEAGVTEARDSGGKNPNQVVETSALKKAPDWRFRIQLASDANYLYKAPGNAGILTPLKGTDGVIFPYAPTINVSYNANYETSDVPHSNFKIYNYRNSSVESISITGDFTAQDTNEANYVLAVIHFFRSVTKMFYGQDQNPVRGTPPPLCYLTGYGDYAFERHPVVITNFTLNYPNDVDYITATIDHEGNASTGGNQQLPIYSAPTIGTPTRLQRLLGAKLAPGGLKPSPPASSFSQDATTRVPTKISITLNALPVVTRFNYSNRFSLKDYATGKLLMGVNKNGGIW